MKLNIPPSPWVTYVRGGRLELFFKDIMRIIFLGFARDFVASAIFERMRQAGVRAANRPAWLRRVTVDMNAWFVSHGMRRERKFFTMSNLGRGDNVNAYPELGSAFKASSIKQMLYWLADWCDKSDVSDCLKVCSWSLADFVHILDNAELYMTLRDRSAALSRGRLHLVTYQVLAQQSVDAWTMLYKVRPKHHQFEELLRDMETIALNPAKYSTFADESFLGKLKLIALRTHGATVMRRTLQRYLLLLGLRFERRRRSSQWRM